ncbi:Rha family transcriptional regulator [Clostridium cadaveris]|uniref:Rha family transcriptional regulator n=1 Tax=Clostridium cadaveris TaxID=1529 RepID=UPI0025A43154|nr:Rha family transcriptional regulator [Clostridium cadaveris]MDM8313281.1 Rha family transcriptional regulator [Clostridium cadaveris]
MKELISIKTHEGEMVVTSREVAENFEKRHDSVLRDIENLIANVGSPQNCGNLFIETKYQHEQNKQTYKEYLLTRDGFTLLAMGFTGSKAIEWKLKYIDAFNKMEQALKEQSKPTCIEDLIIMQAQSLKNIRQQLNQVTNNALEAKAEAEKSREEIQAMRDAITLDSNGWRKETTAIINKIATKLGGFSEVNLLKREIYKLLDTRLGVDVNRRLLEKKKRMALEGVCKSKIDKVNVLDVIAEDKKLIDGYVNIIRQYALKYGVS